MGVDFTTSVAWAAAQARQKQLEQERAAALTSQNQLDTDIGAAGRQAAGLAMQRTIAQEKRGEEEDFNRSVAEGQAAGWDGKPAPQYTTPGMNTGAAQGVASGKMAMAELVAKRQTALDQAKYEEGLNEQRDSRRIGIEAGREKEKFSRENPVTSRQAWYLQQSRNTAAGQRANTIADAMTAGARGKAQNAQMASEQNVIQIDDLLGRMDKLPPGSFNAAGGVHNVQERADTFLKGTPLAGAVGGAIHAVSGGQYQPRSAEDAAAVEDFRLSAQRYLNKQATEGLGMNQTDQEIRRKSAELGQLLNDPNKLMFNDDATMRRALLIGKEIEQKLMAQRARVLSANAAPGTEGARAGQAHSGTAGYAPPPWEDVVEAPERTPAPPVQGPDDSADGTGSPEAYNPAEVFAPEQTPDMAVPQLQMGAALENAGAPTSLEQRVHPGPPPKAPVPTTAVQAARPVLAKMGKGKAKAGGAKLSGPAQQLLAAFTSNDGKFDADGFVESAHRSGMSDADIHAALKSRGL